MRRAIIGVASVIFLAGCLDPDLDGKGPRLLSSNPEDGAQGVSVIGGLLFELSEALDAGTVDTSTVRLTRGSSGLYAGAPTLDPVTNEITFGGEPLAYASDYVVTLDGITDTNANPIDPATITFRTAENPSTGYGLIAGGVPGPYILNTIDTLGNIVQEDEFNDPGPDGDFDTADDVQTYLTAYLFTEPHQLDQEVQVSDPGLDGEWGTSDDVIAEYTAYTFNSDGLRELSLTFTGPGTDGIWFNEDDELGDFYEETYDADGLLQTDAHYVPGPDGLPQTSDDVIILGLRTLYDTHGLQTAIQVTAGPGLDGELFTDDDPGVIEVREFDPANRIALAVRYSDAGLDGVFFTDDDVIDEVVFFNRDTVTGALESIDFTDAAGDITDIIEFAPDGNGQLTQELQSDDPGPDGEFHTADDVFYYSSTTEYDALGNRLTTTEWDAGTDGVLNTEDDEPSSIEVFDNTL